MRRREVPSWARFSLQGFAFWIGWSHERYRNWRLAEGALVAELQRGIASALDQRREAVIAEVDARSLLRPGDSVNDFRKGRVDLIIANRPRRPATQGNRRPLRSSIRYVIEVKRMGEKSKILEDLKRLVHLKRSFQSKARCFLVATGQAGDRSNGFINRDGSRALGLHRLDVVSGAYEVLRVWRASGAVTRPRSAHHVALIEVFTRKTRR